MVVHTYSQDLASQVAQSSRRLELPSKRSPDFIETSPEVGPSIFRPNLEAPGGAPEAAGSGSGASGRAAWMLGALTKQSAMRVYGAYYRGYVGAMWGYKLSIQVLGGSSGFGLI